MRTMLQRGLDQEIGFHAARREVPAERLVALDEEPAQLTEVVSGQGPRSLASAN